MPHATLAHFAAPALSEATGLRYTMTGAEAVELCGLLNPATVMPAYYEGWKHFREGRAAAERAFADGDALAPTWLEIGEPATLRPEPCDRIATSPGKQPRRRLSRAIGLRS